MQTILNDHLNSCGSLWAPLNIHTSKMCRYPYTYIHLRLGLWMATSLDIGLAGCTLCCQTIEMERPQNVGSRSEVTSMCHLSS